MKKICLFFVPLLIVAFFLTACSGLVSKQDSTTWQEQYDLGMKYLAEGRYDEAIVAFTVAIEIDTKQAVAFAGRGKAYIGVAEGESEKVQGKLPEEAVSAYWKALADFLQAISLDGMDVELYESAADIYLVLGETDAAAAILQDGIDKTKNEVLKRKLSELRADKEAEETVPTGFAAKEGYVAFDKLSTIDQERIITAITMLESGERESVCEYLGHSAWKEDDANHTLYTEYGGYRIRNTHQKMVSNNYNRIIDTVEIRPELGQGFICNYTGNLYQNATIEDLTATTGECSNWIWNGAYQKANWYYQDQELATSAEIAGNATEGFLDGTEHTHEISHVDYYRVLGDFDNVYTKGQLIYSPLEGQGYDPYAMIWSVGGYYSTLEAAMKSMDWSDG